MKIFALFEARGVAKLVGITAVFALLVGGFAIISMNIAKADHDPFGGEVFQSQDSVSICHAAGQSGNYTSPSVNVNAIITLPNGHDNHDNDIIPPFHYNLGQGTSTYSGKNWDADGQDIYNNDCVVPTVTGSITIEKVAGGGDAVEFDFSGDLGSFSLDGNTDTGSDHHDVEVGDYTITEIDEEGWNLLDITCDSGSWNDSGSSVTINLAEDDDITCTFTNRPDQGEPEEFAEITAYKIVCSLEEDIPNKDEWASLDPITADTAQDWVDSHDSCELVSGWDFEWILNSEQTDPGDTLVGPAGGDWHTFGSTDGSGKTTLQLSEDDLNGEHRVWFREVLQEDYLTFSHEANPDNSDDVSAGFYCHNDVINYDNLEWIGTNGKPIEVGEEYHCVGWNHIEEEEEKECKIDGHKYDEEGEPLEGWWIGLVKVFGDYGGIFIGGAQTDENGYYCIEKKKHHHDKKWFKDDWKEYDEEEWNQEHGEYDYDATLVAFELLQPGWMPVKIEVNDTPTEPYGDSFFDVFVEVDFGDHVDFYNEKKERPKKGAIHGIKWNDLDGNGQRGEEETLSGWVITLSDDDGVFATTTTDENGEYWFTDLIPGGYLVCEVQQEGWVQTHPADNDCYEIELTKNAVSLVNNFGNQQEGDQCEDVLHDWADNAEDSDQGNKKNGDPITDPNRTDPAEALGESDWSDGDSDGFFSLGFGGSLTVSFDNFVPDVDGDDISIHEATNGVYPLEKASVEVSQNGSDWHLLTEEARNDSNEGGDNVTLLDFSETGLAWIKFVRITDTSDPSLHNDDADGFDVDAVDVIKTVCDEPDNGGGGEPQCLVEGYKFDVTGAPLSGWEIGLSGDILVPYDQGGEGFVPQTRTDITDENGYYCIPEFRKEYQDGPPVGSNYQVGELLQEGWEAVDVLVNGSSTPFQVDSFFDVFVEVDLEEGLRVDFINEEEDDGGSGGEQCLVRGQKFDVAGSPLSGWTIGLFTGDPEATSTIIGTDVTDQNGEYCIPEPDEFDPESFDDIFAFEEMLEGWKVDHVEINGTTTPHATGTTFDVFFEVEVSTDLQVDFFNEQIESGEGGSSGGGGGGGSSSGSRGGSSSGSSSGTGGANPQVLGAATQCGMYLFDYLKLEFDINNPFEVRKLQAFLIGQGYFYVEMNGIFDVATDRAVHEFQTLHTEDVLKPWEATGLVPIPHLSTGYVYQTTRWKINNIVCPESESFPDPLI